MKKKSSIITLILALCLCLAMAVPAFAAENEISFMSEPFFYNAETESLEDENGEPCAFDDIVFEISDNIDDGISSTGDFFEYYLVRSGLKRTSGGIYTWWYNVDCPTSPLHKPNIRVTAQLKGNFTNGAGTFSNVGTSTSHNYTTNADYKVDYTWTTPAKTGYYYVQFTLTDYDAGGKTITKKSGTELWNRTGHLWEFYFTDSDSGKSLPMPPANYIKGELYKRDTSLPASYYKRYTEQTGITLNNSLYDVHHIQPLEYGGNNDYSNLIHLPKTLHSRVSGWFRGY